MKEEKDNELKEAKLVEVTATTAPAVQLESGEVVSELEFLVRMYNKLLRIEKVVA